jgi:hypothetical protein
VNGGPSLSKGVGFTSYPRLLSYKVRQASTEGRVAPYKRRMGS